jgi:hypothetical protein
MIGVQINVKDRSNEDQIRTRLRELTEQSRRVREELAQMIIGRDTSPSRRLLHQQSSWPKRASPPTAADGPPRKPRKKGKTKGNGSAP